MHKMVNLPFLQELAEARLYITPDRVNGKTMDTIAFTIYLMILTLEVLRYIAPSKAREYAAKTLRYDTYHNIFYSGTDLGNLIAVVNNQDTFSDRVKPNKELSVPIFLINRYLRVVSSGTKKDYNEDALFLYRLEQYLKQYNNGTSRVLRREITDWGKITRVDKIRVDRMLRTELERNASSSDIHLFYKANIRAEDLKESADNFSTKLQHNAELNPLLWDGDNLDTEVHAALSKISAKFLEFLDVDKFKVVDVIVTGSNCAYNYTSQSDIDLHVLIDPTSVGEDNPLTDPFLHAKKSLWNSGHDITVRGHSVEIYAEDVTDSENQLVATGIFSLLNNKWVKKPTYVEVSYDDAAVKAKALDLMSQIDYIINNDVNDLDEIGELWSKIRKMRRSGLESGGEYSVENLAFKAIRNNHYFDKLRGYQQALEDDDLTLETIDFLQSE